MIKHFIVAERFPGAALGLPEEGTGQASDDWPGAIEFDYDTSRGRLKQWQDLKVLAITVPEADEEVTERAARAAKVTRIKAGDDRRRITRGLPVGGE